MQSPGLRISGSNTRCRCAEINDPGESSDDLDDARDLIAVSAASNRSKADQDPGEWLPPYVGYRCQYDTDWIADKTRWGLSIDAAERDALTQQLADCADRPITVTLAR